MNNFEQRLKNIIVNSAELPINVEDITLESDLAYDLSYSSISFIQLIVTIEEEFDIIFEDEELDMNLFKKYKSLVDLVRLKLQIKGDSQWK